MKTGITKICSNIWTGQYTSECKKISTKLLKIIESVEGISTDDEQKHQRVKPEITKREEEVMRCITKSYGEQDFGRGRR